MAVPLGSQEFKTKVQHSTKVGKKSFLIKYENEFKHPLLVQTNNAETGPCDTIDVINSNAKPLWAEVAANASQQLQPLAQKKSRKLVTNFQRSLIAAVYVDQSEEKNDVNRVSSYPGCQKVIVKLTNNSSLNCVAKNSIRNRTFCLRNV